MNIFNFSQFSQKNSASALALGAESEGNFSVFHNGKIYFSENYGNLLEDTNFFKFKNALNIFLKKERVTPRTIITDLHPLYKTTLLGQELAKKFKAKHSPVQHHFAHIFSTIGEQSLKYKSYKLQAMSYGIAMDGTGYGPDGNIWGGEIFEIRSQKSKIKSIQRIGHLENQTMLGGDLTIKEPARMLLGILMKIWSLKNPKRDSADKESIFKLVEKFYTRNQFELLYNQLQQNFNCQKTSSTGRILDAVSVLLGFCKNERKYKHAPITLLEQNSTRPYTDLKPALRNSCELLTTHLFGYLIKNLHKNKKRLAATAQLYISQGLHKITKEINTRKHPVYLSGGIANNKIISQYFIARGATVNKEIPRGDAGISFGQIIYFLLS